MREGGRHVSDRVSGLLVGSPAGSQAPKNCQGGPARCHPTRSAPPERRPRCASGTVNLGYRHPLASRRRPVGGLAMKRRRISMLNTRKVLASSARSSSAQAQPCLRRSAWPPVRPAPRTCSARWRLRARLLRGWMAERVGFFPAAKKVKYFKGKTLPDGLRCSGNCNTI